MIPKIIHQTWKTKFFDSKIAGWTSSWKSMNPDFKYIFYDDYDCYLVIKNNFPQFFNLYLMCSPIERADIFRYLILYLHGGFYADIDTICLKSIRPLIYFNKLITGIEYESSGQYLQWFIGCPKNCIILIKLVEEINRRYYFKFFMFKNKNQLTYWFTGPELFTDILNKYPHDIKVFQKGIFGCYDNNKITSSSYLQHLFYSSWK
jgi:hypothetical protein